MPTLSITATPLGQEDRVRGILYRHQVTTIEAFESLSDSSPCMLALYTEFVDSGVMPYGVAKARTGDPVDWIRNRVIPVLELEALVNIAFQRGE